jgi:hypothetical protein
VLYLALGLSQFIFLLIWQCGNFISRDVNKRTMGDNSSGRGRGWKMKRRRRRRRRKEEDPAMNWRAQNGHK